jgi:hypothetical protein
MATATIHVPGLKVAVVLAADQLPRDLVPMDGPAGEPTIDLVLDGGPPTLTVRARVNGKNYRKMLRQIAEAGADNLVIVLQGKMVPPPAPGGPFVLDGAGFQVTVKQTRPATPE